MMLKSGAAENFIEVEVSVAELFADLALDASDSFSFAPRTRGGYHHRQA